MRKRDANQVAFSFFRAIFFLGPFHVLFLPFPFQFMMVMWPEACIDHEIELKSEIDVNKYLKDRKWIYVFIFKCLANSASKAR